MKGYTLRQLRLFSEAVERQERRRNAGLLVLLRAAQFDKKGFDAVYKGLTK